MQWCLTGCCRCWMRRNTGRQATDDDGASSVDGQSSSSSSKCGGPVPTRSTNDPLDYCVRKQWMYSWMAISNNRAFENADCTHQWQTIAGALSRVTVLSSSTSRCSPLCCIDLSTAWVAGRLAGPASQAALAVDRGLEWRLFVASAFIPPVEAGDRPQCTIEEFITGVTQTRTTEDPNSDAKCFRATHHESVFRQVPSHCGRRRRGACVTLGLNFPEGISSMHGYTWCASSQE